ncbi:hypothetical protein D1007_37818 [Hordeum vulgare]|nr:hypothetical protein D1007_37818 [Hordeum vulgare]
MPPKKYTVPRPSTSADSSQPKQRKPAARPSGISDVGVEADVQRREAVTVGRRKRLDARRIRDAAAVALELDQEEARAGMMNPPDCNPQTAWRCR